MQKQGSRGFGPEPAERPGGAGRFGPGPGALLHRPHFTNGDASYGLDASPFCEWSHCYNYLAILGAELPRMINRKRVIWVVMHYEYIGFADLPWVDAVQFHVS